MLTFDESSHTYRFSGAVVPGVTSILRPLQDFSGIPPQVLAAKADLGRRVHSACEFLDEDDLDESTIEDDVAPYLDAYRLFLAESGALVLLNERRVYHSLYGYAGQLDRVLSFNDETWLVDLKTCITTPRAAGPQTAAYMAALSDQRVKRRAALRLRPDGTYRFEPLDDPNDWAVFMSCLTLKRFLESNT